MRRLALPQPQRAAPCQPSESYIYIYCCATQIPGCLNSMSENVSFRIVPFSQLYFYVIHLWTIEVFLDRCDSHLDSFAAMDTEACISPMEMDGGLQT